MGGCNWNCNEPNAFQITVKCIVYTQLMSASALLKNSVSTMEWITALLLWDKETLFSAKNYSLKLNAVTYDGKHFFKNNYSLDHSLFSELLFH